MRPSAVFLFLAACSNGGAVLGTLDGSWQGELDADGALIGLVAEFEWVERGELLFGRVQLALPNEPQTT